MAGEGVAQEDVDLVEKMWGYEIRVDGERAGRLEGRPGYLEYISIELAWENQGVARAALKQFITLSRAQDCTEVMADKPVHPTMKYILETEGFERNKEGNEWRKSLGKDQADN